MPILEDVTVNLIGEDGNAFAILARVKNAMNTSGYADKYDQFENEATSADYDNLIRVVIKWVNVSNNNEYLSE